jgi:TonB family protein
MRQRNVKSGPTSVLPAHGHSGGVDRVSHWLIHHAACRAPESLSERLEEEWLADLEVRCSAASRLRFSLGCCWATRVIVHDHYVSSIAGTTTTIAGARSMLAYAPNRLGSFSRRTTAFILVVCLHVAVFYAFLVGLSHTLGRVIELPLQNRALQAPHVRELPPLPTLPQLHAPRLDAPMPEVMIADAADAGGMIGQAPEAQIATVSPPAVEPAHAVRQVQGGPGVGFPNPDDFYPALAKHMEEQGLATVRVCVDASGRLIADPTILQSTGSSRLDEGALKLARAGSSHYRATTEEGRPVNSCYPLRIRFQLKN